MTAVSARDPRYRAALDDIAETVGARIENVLLPSQWAVHEIEGRAQVTVSMDGLRALALLSDVPGATARCEELVETVERYWKSHRT